MSVPTRAELDAIIREKLDSDPDFRQQLLADPRTVLASLVGTPIPDFITLTVHEESLTDVHLVIPAAVGEDLAEQDLELVAGGVCWNDFCQWIGP